MPSALGLPGFAELEPRDTTHRPGPIPYIRIKLLASPTVLESVVSETTGTSIAAAGASQTCGPNDNTGFCQKYVTASTETLPIVLGVVIPLVGAFVLFLFLHRRHKKKLKKEDEDDAHKSLDFGLGENRSSEKSTKKGRNGKANKKSPEMSATDAAARTVRPLQERGLSMDLDATNPYLLPPGLESSRESLHSLSRTLNTADDKYRSTGFIPNDGSVSYPSSLRSPVGDDGSSFTASINRRFDGGSNQNLLKNAQRMSGSQSRNASISATDRQPLAPPKNSNLAAPGNAAPRESYMSTNSSIGPNAALRASNNYLGQFISGGFLDQKEKEQPREQGSSLVKTVTTSEEAPRAPEKAFTKDTNTIKRRSMGQMYPPPSPPKDEPTAYHNAATTERPEDDREPRLPSLSIPQTAPLSEVLNLPVIDDNGDQYRPREEQEAPTSHNHDSGELRPESKALPNLDDRRETRQPTLPILDPPRLAEHKQQEQAQPAHTEEEDYYDDYYDDDGDQTNHDPQRISGMGERPLPPDDPSENPEQRANRIRSFYKEYFDESNKPGRTPSKPSRQDYYDGSENYSHDGYDVNQYYDDQGSYRSPNPSRGPSRQARFNGHEGRHRATFSTGSFQSSGPPRAYSGASGRFAPPGRRGPPKKNLPPPKPLMTLPTPHMLKDDSFLTHMPIDFAPPGAYKGQRAGTPDSLRGEMKPYTPRRAHVPLASSFDDLAVMPSP